MLKINLTIKNTENLGDWSAEKKEKIEEIFTALVSSGGLVVIKNGRTIIHFDGNGDFIGIALDYWPWRKRKKI
jgi:hypothetical protein